MHMPELQSSHRGFEQYADNTGTKAKIDVDSPADVKISNNIQKISHHVKELKDLVDNIGTQFDSREVRNKLKRKQETTNTLSKVTSALLKEYTQACPTDQKRQREWKVQQSRFKDMFHDVLKEYNELQKVIRAKERITLRESLASSGIQSVHLDDSGSFVNDSGKQIQIETIQEEVNLEQLKSRQDELQQLESDIVDINYIFKDLATMVQEQGEQLDQIEEKVEAAAIDVEEGVKDLEVAVEYTTASRKKVLCLALAVFIVVAVVVTIILLVAL